MKADLRKGRFEEAPPFTYCPVDMFESSTVRVTRSDMKHSGEMFTWFAGRAVHTEETDSFIEASSGLLNHFVLGFTQRSEAVG